MRNDDTLAFVVDVMCLLNVGISKLFFALRADLAFSRRGLLWRSSRNGYQEIFLKAQNKRDLLLNPRENHRFIRAGECCSDGEELDPFFFIYTRTGKFTNEECRD
jgi:hypothetical protein